MGSLEYTYTCTGEGGTATARFTVVVLAVPPVGQRVTRDRPDDVPGNQTQFVSMRSSDGPDRGHDWNGQMETVINSAVVFLAGKTGKIPVVDTYGGRPDVLFVQSPKTHAELLGNQSGGDVIIPLLNELGRLIGGLQEKKKYIIFYEPLSNPGVAGSAVLGGAGGGIYPFYTQWDGALVDPDGNFPPFIPYGRNWLHELFHALGAVGQFAPHGYRGHVMDDQCDLMYGFPQPPGPPVEPQECITATGPEIDRGGDGRTPGDDWFGDNVPAGVFNAKLSPFLIPAPPEMVAMGKAMMRAQTLRAEPAVRYEFREELVLLPKRPHQ